MPPEIEPERLVDLRPSCTRDEAIAKLLGWRRGPLVPKYFDVNVDGVRVDQIPLLQSTEMPLHEQLAALREPARRALLAAAEGDAAPGELDEKEAALVAFDELITKARTYSVHIEDELAKGADSALQIDAAATSESGEEHITLASLDRWARERYGLSVLDAALSAPHTQSTAGSPVPDEEQEDGEEWGPTAARNFAATFLLALEALADKSGPGFRKDDGTLNMSEVAKALERKAKEANKGDVPSGQGAEAIRKRIQKALILQR